MTWFVGVSVGTIISASVHKFFVSRTICVASSAVVVLQDLLRNLFQLLVYQFLGFKYSTCHTLFLP